MDWGVLGQTYFQHALLAACCAGIACGVTGVFVVASHLAFLGVCIAHAAFAGALLGVWLGFEPLYGALAFSLCAAAAIGPLAERGQLSPDTSAGIIFSLMLGLAFLFIGLMPGSRTQALSLFWGSILTVSRTDLVFLVITAAAVVGLLALFFKEVQAVLCHRDVALAVGIPASVAFYGMLFATGFTIAVSLRSIGGLLIYSLLLNPASAAFQLTYNLKAMFVLAAVFGVASCWAGLAASYLWDVPAGASIVITSSLLFGAAMLVSPKRKAKSPWRTTASAK